MSELPSTSMSASAMVTSPTTESMPTSVVLQGYSGQLSTSTIDPHLISPFPELPTEHDHSLMSATSAVTSALTAATAAAISSALASAQLGNQTMNASALAGDQHQGVLDSLQRKAHEQVMEIMTSYQQTHAHRRRSSVEAAAAASSVLASIASSTKPYPGDSGSPQHSAAAAALLAASGMHGVVLPTIPSESVSLRGTPGPMEVFDSQLSSMQNLQVRPPPLNIPTRDDDDDDDSLSDGSGRGTSNGMPMTPDAPGSGRPGSLRHLTPDERRARRLQRNRLAAKECRQKKKAYINNLEAQVSDLQAENTQLRKELEEANAKLTLSVMHAASSVTTPTLDAKNIDGLTSEDSLAVASKRPRIDATDAAMNISSSGGGSS
ncbi:hypothetical protein LPJ66_002614 [Kickxella alabastrina]|uniref:Uncharacterized protein n=1 Tax=Kickxella alabastrina TaxID=61397 RepID=A0ACC1IPY3_9FUNG|nr:hypothetical protein LPJ66_002614 [Kickxella alabastrina]